MIKFSNDLKFALKGLSRVDTEQVKVSEWLKAYKRARVNLAENRCELPYCSLEEVKNNLSTNFDLLEEKQKKNLELKTEKDEIAHAQEQLKEVNEEIRLRAKIPKPAPTGKKPESDDETI